MQNLEVHLEKYQGPLYALLELIEKRKLSINEVALKEVTDEFIKQTKELSLPKKLYAEFIEISAILIFIKSKSLLPFVEEEADEDSEELQNRLKILQLLKQEAEKLKSDYATQQYLLSAILPRKFKFAIEFRPYKEFNSLTIARDREAILNTIPIFTEPVKVTRRKVRTLQEVLQDIEAKLNEKVKFTFSELRTESKEEKILSFMAILELRRNGKINLTQKGRDDIEIFLDEDIISVPHYG